MSSYNIYHIVPRDGRWASRLQGASTVSVEAERRDEVLHETESIIRRLGAGRIVLHAEDGTIESVHTFDQIISAPESGWLGSQIPTPVLIGFAAACLIGVGFALRGRD